MTSGKRERGSELGVDAGRNGSVKSSPVSRFQCDADGCGKNYSRAEHLARHKLNHSPREIIRCDFPNCERWFVRQDLCTRHYERHFRGRGQGPDESNSDNPDHGASSQQASLSAVLHSSGSIKRRRVGRPKLADRKPQTPPATNISNERLSPQGSRDTGQASFAFQTDGATVDGPSTGARYTSYDAEIERAELQAPELGPTHPSMVAGAQLTPAVPQSPATIAPPAMGLHADRTRRATVDSTYRSSLIVDPSLTVNEPGLLGASPSHGLIPSYHDHFSDSPGSARQDEFTNWLFDDFENFYSGVGLPNHIGMLDDIDQPYSAPFPDTMDNFNLPAFPRQASLPYDQTMPLGAPTWLSEARWRHLIEFMQLFFNSGKSSPGHFDRDSIFGGNHEVEDHVLSLKMMNTYIASYWQSYHEQMPILHKPTFSANEMPELLLLAIIMVGAGHVSTGLGDYIKGNAHHFATFVAWHIRWHIFMHDDFHPPAKLWVLQALILLELYEKMKSTRFLHERANLHNATTINLIRRGTALVDSTAVPDMQKGTMTPQDWWNRWVIVEATRRAAFAAFLMDASHGAMFGHTNYMVAHEIQLPLPCDEALWSATTPSEVGRVEASLYANNVRPMTFLQGLKRMLSGRKVRTNAFGRMVLLAGLQSVSWHMRQREKVSSLSRGLGSPEIWRQTLTKAFDFWKLDFDEDFTYRKRAFKAWQHSGAIADSNVIAEYASAMHHLSHLAMQIDFIDAQILAGAHKVLGRLITNSDKDRVRRSMSHWRNSPGADIAFSHAVELLLDYFPEGSEIKNASRYSIADDCVTIRPWTLYFAALTAWCYVFVKQHPNEQISAASSDSSGAMESGRPTPEKELPKPTSLNNHRMPTRKQHNPLARDDLTGKQGVQSAVMTVAGVNLARRFGAMQLQKTMQTLQYTLQQSRWELLQEAAERLRNALEMLTAR